MLLSECPGKSNNLQLIRFIAAVMVIISHSFSISTGDGTKEWLELITNGQISMGGLAVSVFFCAGGYLIAKSIERVNKGSTYFRARIFRIFPALIAVVVVSAFVLGPLVTEYSFTEYFKDSGTYRYLLNALLILQHNLPGVFVDNPSVPTVNGALWTLPVEFLCYVLCFLLWKMKLLKKESFKWTIPLVILGTAGLYVVINYIKIDILVSALRPGLLFYMGILFYVYRDDIKFTKGGVLINLAGIIISCVVGILDIGLVICFPYILLYLCFVLPQVSDKLGKTGNISYGIYLCGFPIQQTIVMLAGGYMLPYINIMLAIPLAIIIGYLIYNVVEVPVVKFEKSKLRKI